ENLGPAPALSNIFLVHFHGTFIPLQGIATIIATAKLLEGEAEIKFRIIGSGQESAKIEALVAELKPTNIEFLPRMSFTDLVDKIKTADLVLGIFGQTDKATRVIPNKVFEALALGKPVLTADSPAARELLTDQENVLFSKAGDSADLAAKILWLKENPVVRGKLSAGARALFNKQLNPKLLVAEFLVKLDNENRPHYSRT
ncbi:MAG: glycosyltransferase, partial [Patescibacteria group bacterium]